MTKYDILLHCNTYMIVKRVLHDCPYYPLPHCLVILPTDGRCLHAAADALFPLLVAGPGACKGDQVHELEDIYIVL